MSDDQPLPQFNAAEESQAQVEERSVKTEPSVTQEEVKPLSQQPEPPKDGYQHVVQKIRQHDEAMLANKLVFSALPKEHRDEYNKLIAEKDSYIEAIHTHIKKMKEEEKDFENEDPDAWKDALLKDSMEYQAVAYCAASSKMFERNVKENQTLKRRIEELENEKKASPPPVQQAENKVHSTGNAVSSFTSRLPSPTQSSSAPTNNSAGQTKGLGINALEKMTHREDWLDHPTRPANVLGNKLTRSFGWFKQELTTNK